MVDFDITDYDFCGPNIQKPSELAYIGKLYHYTDIGGCDGIFNPHDCSKNPISLPPDCISLRLTKIVCVDRNDNHERQYVQEIVEAVINDLLARAEITDFFANAVRTFQPTGMGFYSIATNKIDKELGLPIIKWDYAKLDYYIACFSTNPDNEYIMKTFKYPIRLAFASAFSNPKVVNYYCDLPPYSNISQCSLYDHTPYKLRKVLYDKSSKYAVIEKFLIGIYNRIPQDMCAKCQEKYIKEQVEEMYSLYDAIFKSSEGDYYKEEEVRFIIAIRSSEDHSLLEQFGFVFDHDPKNGKDYLYVPISKQFLVGGGFDA